MKKHPTIETDWEKFNNMPFVVVMYSSELGWVSFAQASSPSEAHKRFDDCDCKNKMLLNYGSIIDEEHEPD